MLLKTSKKKLKVWLRDPLPVTVIIKEIAYVMQQDVIHGGSQTMFLEVVRQDTGKHLALENLPSLHLLEEYVRHAWFESVPGTPERKLADALLAQGLAVPDPPPEGWLFKYEKLPWEQIALGCDWFQSGWNVKTEDTPPKIWQKDFLIRY